MKWIDWQAPPQAIARRLLWLALLAGLVTGAAAGGGIVLGIIHY